VRAGLWDGLMSICATALMVVIITGVLSMFVSPETRVKLVTAGIKSAVSALYGEVAIIDNLTGEEKPPVTPPKNKQP